MALARQFTFARYELPLLKAISESNLFTPYAIDLTKAQAALSVKYKFFEAAGGKTGAEVDRCFIVCALTGGPETPEEMARAYKEALAAEGGDSAAGVAAARAVVARPKTLLQSATSERTEQAEGSARAADFGLAADVTGGWHVTSVLDCSCQMRKHLG